MYCTQGPLFFSKFCPEPPVSVPADASIIHCFALWRSKSECGLSNTAWNILMAINSYSFFIPSHKLQVTLILCSRLMIFARQWKTFISENLLFMSYVFHFPKTNVPCLQTIHLTNNQQVFCIDLINWTTHDREIEKQF